MGIKLEELATALEKSDALQGYVDLVQEKVVLVGEEFAAGAEGKEVSEEETLAQVFDIEEDWQHFIALPNLGDSEERRMMASFAETREGEQRERLLDILAGQNCVARFHRQLKAMGCMEEWLAHQHRHFLAVARDWCEENEIPFEE